MKVSFPHPPLTLELTFNVVANFGGNENGGLPNDCTCFSNVFMTSHVYPIHGPFPSNSLNGTKTSLTM